MTKKHYIMAGVILIWMLASAGGLQAQRLTLGDQRTGAPSSRPPRPDAWESQGKLHHSALGSTPGTLRIGSQGIEFIPIKGTSIHWSPTEIQSLDVRKRRVILVGYDNRKWPLPGTRRFDLQVKNEIPAAVAASLIAKIVRPAINGIPDPSAPAETVIAVRRSKHYGGSNGLLRIRQQGIDYITAQPGESRSWRWRDLQTVSNPDPYHLLVFGYRDSYAFDLKDALTRNVFNHLCDEIWTHNDGEVIDGVVSSGPARPIDGSGNDE